MKSRLIHLGKPIPDLPELLEKLFDCVDVPFDQIDQPLGKNEACLFKDDELNPIYRHDQFFITQPEYLQSTALLRKLPANLIIIDEDLPLNGAAKAGLALKNAQFISCKNVENLADELIRCFHDDQLGFKFRFDNIQIDPYFWGQIYQNGHNYLRIIDHDIDDFQRVASWGGGVLVGEQTNWDVRTEFKRYNQTSDLMLNVMVINPDSGEIQFSQTCKNEELNDLILLSIPKGATCAVLVEVWVKGSDIKIDMGNISIRKSRGGRGILTIGEEEAIDDEASNEQLYHYFDPGDFRPPLVVYFSGFRYSLGVEGTYMMRGFKSPTLLFGEQRILGGSFYVGSKKFEKQIVQIIQETLDKLGFTSDQLILTGLSMGTYASLYYSSLLNPSWVVIGKPLTNLGDIAANERINRPESFPTSLDVMLRLTGGIEDENVQRANAIFWKNFKQHDHSKTNFVIAYMKEDDYDPNAFERIYSYLHSNSSQSRIIHKGLTGRHNDDTHGILTWFLAQIRNILTNQYGRKFKVEVADDDDDE